MSGSLIPKSYNPFLLDKLSDDKKKEFFSIIGKQKANEFSERLKELLSEKSALKIDYHEIHRDLKSFGFPIKVTEAKNYNSGLDAVRLKAGLHIMDICFKDLNEGNDTSDESQEYFQKEVCKVFEILSRDYTRLSENFVEKLNDDEKLNLPELENQLQSHIKFYNHFTHLIENYLNYISGGSVDVSEK